MLCQRFIITCLHYACLSLHTVDPQKRLASLVVTIGFFFFFFFFFLKKKKEKKIQLRQIVEAALVNLLHVHPIHAPFPSTPLASITRSVIPNGTRQRTYHCRYRGLLYPISV
jgi:hypothetical protein